MGDGREPSCEGFPPYWQSERKVDERQVSGDCMRKRNVRRLAMSEDNAVCEQFRHDFPAYLVKVLIPSRRVLLEEHLSRCPSCRKRIAELRGKRTVTDVPVRSSSRWVRLGTLAAAASLLIAIVYVG